ncbi:glycosyltransferase family 39 protein [Actinoplanes sp. N902-109]|uniref:glycosyltransferase family 39 protein n=1 Tax=Actinoplanes sp. (strain N902-109) TaxID=649831 RepID=UPI000329427B|nr:glycosyltransferase family 39 protein [Actinoplanes sp. N902-109]AGL20832.1 hypothetical protein L083_7322 [Actinoplanes sp. N902-109]
MQRIALAIAVGGIVAPVLVALAHLFDFYGLEHGAGTWVSLADWARRGQLIPPISTHGFYAGTRYMPLPVLVQSWLTDLSHNEIAGGRLVSIAGVLVLVTSMLFAMRRCRLAWAPSLLLTAGVLMTPALGTSIVSIRNDALPAGLQLLVVAMLADERIAQSRRMWLLAGVLAGLAVNWKASAVWCIAAVVLSALLQRRRFRELRVNYLAFAGGLIGVLSVGCAFALLATDGRVVENFRELLFSSEYSALDVGLWVKPYTVALISGMVVLTPIVFYGLFHLAAGRQVPVLLRASALCCTLFTTSIFVDFQGATVNHLIDLIALGVVGFAWVTSTAWRSTSDDRASTALLTAAVVVLIGLVGTWYDPLRGALRGEVVPAYSLDNVPVAPGPILAENPLFDLAVGQQPVITDTFAFRRLAIKHPELKDGLIRRIRGHDFAAVVLLSKPGRESSSWYQDQSMGGEVLDAICTSYHSEALIADGKFELYLPGRPAALPVDSPCNQTALRY